MNTKSFEILFSELPQNIKELNLEISNNKRNSKGKLTGKF